MHPRGTQVHAAKMLVRRLLRRHRWRKTAALARAEAEFVAARKKELAAAAERKRAKMHALIEQKRTEGTLTQAFLDLNGHSDTSGGKGGAEDGSVILRTAGGVRGDNSVKFGPSPCGQRSGQMESASPPGENLRPRSASAPLAVGIDVDDEASSGALGRTAPSAARERLRLTRLKRSASTSKLWLGGTHERHLAAGHHQGDGPAPSVEHPGRATCPANDRRDGQGNSHDGWQGGGASGAYEALGA